MRIVIPLFLILISVSCKRHEKEIDVPKKIESVSSDTLSPKDFGINKYSFVARPSEKEVAVFRTRTKNRLKPYEDQVYDQIFWRSDSKEVQVDVVVVPRSFYIGYPEYEELTEENSFRDSWRLSAGLFHYDIDEYSFETSNFSTSEQKVNGNIVYTKNSKTRTKDLEFTFDLFIITLEEAKAMHPELEKDRKVGTTSWNAAFLRRIKTEAIEPNH